MDLYNQTFKKKWGKEFPDKVSKIKEIIPLPGHIYSVYKVSTSGAGNKKVTQIEIRITGRTNEALSPNISGP